jgi:hypothetical protein
VVFLRCDGKQKQVYQKPNMTEEKSQPMFATFGKKLGEDGRHRVVVKLVGVPNTDSEVATFLSELDEVYKSNTEFITLYDARAVGKVPPAVLWTIAAFLRARDDQTRERQLGVAIVLSSDFARTLLKSLFVLKPPACPLKTFSEVVEAKTWLRTLT